MFMPLSKPVFKTGHSLRRSESLNYGLFYTFISIVLMFSSTVFGEKVGSIRYTGYPEYLDGRTILREDDIVALAEKITAFDSSSSFSSGGGATSVMLVMDHSTSMLLNLIGNSNPQPKDPQGVRYKVATKLIDELQKLSPETEVGLSIFSSYLYLDPNDDPLFEELNTYKEYSKIQGGFIPLLKLNKEVTKGNHAGMTGAEVIKKYLETRDTTLTYKGGINNFKKLAYEPTNSLLDPLRVKEVHNQSSGTNIWAGFAAAKEAMLKSSVPKQNQFIIFFSDGAHSHIPSGTGPGNNDWDEVTAPNVPTTFCVYFNVAGVAWPMEDFLEFIQTNNYSNSNPLSSFEKMSAGEDEVMEYMKKSVISKIVTNTTYVTPEEIMVNGVNCTNWIKAMDWFVFDDLWALNKGKTDFDIDLRYSRKVVDANSGDETPLPDTTVSIAFSVSESGEDISDSLDVVYWGRRLKLFENANEVTASDIIDESMTDLRIQFESYEVDTTYEYDAVPVTVTTVNGSDSEKYTLVKNGSQWELEFTREEGGASSGDGTLQHQNPDTLVFTFNNPDLPLDTLQIKRYYYQESSGITLQSAALFDTDANGFADSIAIKFAGKDVETVKDKIVDAIVLPNDRDFDITGSTISGNILSLNVDEKSGTIKTITDSKDTLVVENEVVLNDKLFLNPCRLTLNDKMAPVVLSASVVDSADESGRDDLTVIFSEDITESSLASKPFELYSLDASNTYDVILAVLDFKDDEVLFEITSVNGRDRIAQGDSLRIKADASTIISDKKGNEQDNNKNLRREIDVEIIDKAMRLGDAAYFDRDANGFVDSLVIEIRGSSLDASDANALTKKLVLPTHRDLSVTANSYKNGELQLLVNERSGTVRTFTDERDTVALKDTFFLAGSDAFLIPSTIRVDDRIAPIVMEASVLDSAKEGSRDELTVILSEELKSISTDEPFSFYSGTDSYEVKLSLINENGTEYLFEIESVSGQSSIIQGDSLHFNGAINMSDEKNNTQNNGNNIKRKIDVTVIEEGIKITGAVYFDTNADGFIDSLSCAIYGKESLIEKHLNTIVNAIDLNDDRAFDIISSNYKNNEISLTIKEQSNTPQTAVTSKDVLRIKEKIEIETDSTIILSTEVPCKDSVAPVLLSASVVDSQIVVLVGEKDSVYTNANGELTVTFSEKVDDHFINEPFALYRDSDAFNTKVEPLTFDGDKVLYQILNIDEHDKIETGDSIHILDDESSDLVDLVDNKQLNEDNIKREIQVETFYDTIRVPAPYDLEFKSTVLQRGYNEEESRVREEDTVPHMVIIIEPDKKENFCDADSLEATLRIFDNVGNEVSEDLSMEFDSERKRLILFWDGKNLQGRNVGRGSCAIVAEIVRYFEGEVRDRKRMNTLVGVQEEK